MPGRGGTNAGPGAEHTKGEGFRGLPSGYTGREHFSLCYGWGFRSYFKLQMLHTFREGLFCERASVWSLQENRWMPTDTRGTGTHITSSVYETKLPRYVGRFECFWVTWPNHTLLKMQCVWFQ